LPNPLADRHRIEVARRIRRVAIVEIADGVALVLHQLEDRLPVACRVVKIVGLAVEEIERLAVRRNGAQQGGQLEPQFLRKVADGVMIGVDQLAAVFGDLVLRELAARREAAPADARVAFIDIGIDPGFFKLARRSEAREPRTHDGDFHAVRRCRERQEQTGAHSGCARQHGAAGHRCVSKPLLGTLFDRRLAGRPLQEMHQRRSRHGPLPPVDTRASYAACSRPTRAGIRNLALLRLDESPIELRRR
jgi:hypothetical protein